MLAVLTCLGALCATGSTDTATGATPHPAPVAASSPSDSLATRLQACTGCHGPEGRADSGGYLPRIAGKPPAYLYHQLRNFSRGLRSQAAMQAMVTPLADRYLREIANYFGSLDLPYPAPQAGLDARTGGITELARGETLVHRGDPKKQIPPCANCHGPTLTGRLPAIPGLIGLPRDYLAAQLGAWRLGQRHADAPDCMATIAQRLSSADVSAAALWLSAQTPPPHARPAAIDPTPLPMACGSQDATAGVTSDGTLPADLPPAAAQSTVSSGAPASNALPSAALESGTQGALLARGAYLARAGHCAGCHTQRGGADYGGGRAILTPFGTAYSSNLTPDRAHGLGNWSADDFWHALHEGRSRDGHLLSPAFPYSWFTRMVRADSDALFVWLRTLPAAADVPPANALRFPYGTQAAIAIWRTLYFRPGEFVSDPGRDAIWNRGAYLVEGAGHCGACHTARNFLGGSQESAALTGGLMEPQAWYAPSLRSSHPAALSGAADAMADVERLLATGVATGHAGGGPMAEVIAGSTQYLTSGDIHAVAVYLDSLPSTARADQLSRLAQGRTIYEAQCASCHGRGGEGAAGIWPALAGNRNIMLKTPVNAIQGVLNGGFPPSTAGNPRPYGMPPFRQRLGNAEIAAVVTYIRSSWGNGAGEVTETEVDRLR